VSLRLRQARRKFVYREETSIWFGSHVGEFKQIAFSASLVQPMGLCIIIGPRHLVRGF